MKRREFISLLGGATVAWPLAARAQQGGRIARVGVLAGRPENPITAEGLPIFRTELHKLGFTEGQNLLIEHRRIDEGVAKAFAGANDLVAAKADVLVASGAELALQAADAARPPCRLLCLPIISTQSRAAT